MAVAGALAAPAAAPAATFYVDDSAGSPNTPCTSASPEDACTSIQTAITQARAAGFPGGDTIRVAPGAYHESITMNVDDDAGNTIDGAGSAAGPTGTTVNPAAPAAAVVTKQAIAPNVTIRDIRVEVVTPEDRPGLGLSGSGTLSNVAVDMQQPTNGQVGVFVNTGPYTIDRLAVGGNWQGAHALSTSQPPAGSTLTIRDSSLRSGGNAPALGVTNGWHVNLQRSRLQSPTTNGGATFNLTDSSATIDSSLILGGNSSLLAGVTSQPRTVRIRNSTLDPRAPGATGGTAILMTDNGPDALVDSSILVGGLFAGASAAITCTDSDLELEVSPGIACGATNRNSSSVPSALFVNPAGGDYHLKAGSPAIETGAVTGLVAGESTTDLDGNARVLDGNRDCRPRRDRGAYEKTGQSAACPKSTTPGKPANVAPVISEVALSRKRFRAAGGRRKARVGTRVTYTLSEAAKVTFTVQRRKRVRRKLRWVKAGSFSQQGKQGENAKRFKGRLKGKRLRRARYRLVLRARDATGKRSTSKRVRFRVVR